ncbi:Homogentisate 1,2-dioxygenase [Madurella mycetomatis]|uniref:homogentisate 1,2-dioxygenase n=1 Tax=Madurella mycetomatis TaxID=100816 RepID=A0A175W0Y4_9PEZI|nr:Homogentisate 1,2-dioxygenase [Madurella mycetomatis]
MSVPSGKFTDGSAACPKEASFEDPYKYQCGFGNYHATEAMSGALPPSGSNLPQKGRYGLYAEHLNGTPFISPRHSASNVWMYRGRPAVAHQPLQQIQRRHDIEACFLPSNPSVAYTPLPYTWGPLTTQEPDPSRGGDITFIQGLKTVGGHGDATLKEGLAIHQYVFNSDMHRQAFVNHDGEFLLIPQRGLLDIKTELGNLRVKPGMIVVLPAGIRFSINIVTRPLPTGQLTSETEMYAAGYVLEVCQRACSPRDFEYPVARFEREAGGRQPWEITIKLAGRLYAYAQAHSPFDVVAWHGKYAPFRYDLSRFGHLSANTDQLDPTAYCVLTAPSKWPNVSLVDFCIFGEKWAVAENTLRIPYYHRTTAAELCGVIFGQYKGSVRPLEAGGLSFEQSYMPHGESYEAHRQETEAKHKPVKVAQGYLGFMFHIPSHIGLTTWAMHRHPDIRPERVDLWDSMQNHFLDHTDGADSSL